LAVVPSASRGTAILPVLVRIEPAAGVQADQPVFCYAVGNPLLHLCTRKKPEQKSFNAL